jgi:predicted dehydrogenase
MPKSSRPVKWGVLGTGPIAKAFARQLTKIDEAVKWAVASHNPQNAVRFAREYGFSRPHQSLDAFFGDTEIEVIYIATPTRLHQQHCLQALKAGRAILCEKPFTGSVEEARVVVERARSLKLFCMEAMWLRFNPLIQQCKQLIQDGSIGDVSSMHVEIGYKKDIAELGAPSDAMGAMLVYGCYPLSLSYFFFGTPQSVQFSTIYTKDDVDITSGVVLGYPAHTVSLTVNVNGTESNEAHIVGSRGSVKIHSPFINATDMTVISERYPPPALRDRLYRKIDPIITLFGYRFSILDRKRRALRDSGLSGEAIEAMRCIEEGLTESPWMPLDETLEIHDLLDRIRSDVRSESRATSTVKAPTSGTRI